MEKFEFLERMKFYIYDLINLGDSQFIFSDSYFTKDEIMIMLKKTDFINELTIFTGPAHIIDYTFLAGLYKKLFIIEDDFDQHSRFIKNYNEFKKINEF